MMMMMMMMMMMNESGIDKEQQLYIKQDVLKQTFPGQ